MSRSGFTEVGRVVFRELIADTTTFIPTAAELTSASTVDLTPSLRRDGLSIPKSANTTDLSDAASRKNKTGPGSYGGDNITMKFNRDSSEALDKGWTTFPPGRTGYLIVRRFGGSSAAFANNQNVEVYQVECLTRAPVDIGDNEGQQCEVTLTVTDWNDDAYVGGLS